MRVSGGGGVRELKEGVLQLGSTLWPLYINLDSISGYPGWAFLLSLPVKIWQFQAGMGWLKDGYLGSLGQDSGVEPPLPLPHVFAAP